MRRGSEVCELPEFICITLKSLCIFPHRGGGHWFIYADEQWIPRLFFGGTDKDSCSSAGLFIFNKIYVLEIGWTYMCGELFLVLQWPGKFLVTTMELRFTIAWRSRYRCFCCVDYELGKGFNCRDGVEGVEDELSAVSSLKSNELALSVSQWGKDLNSLLEEISDVMNIW